MEKFIAKLDRVLAVFLIALMSALVLSVVWQVLSRYILSSPSSATEEIARYLMIWVGLLGAAYAFRLRMHLGLNIITEKLQGRSKRNAEIIGLIAAAIFAIAVMIIGGGKLVFLTAELHQTTAVLGIPTAYVYSVIPLSGFLICIYVINFLREVISPASGDDQQEINHG